MTEKLSSEWEERFRAVEENYKRICDGIAQAAADSSRKPEEITLLAATKTVPVEVINHSIALGISHIGENRVQELCEKYDGYAPVDVQFIGHLQTNKVRQIISKVSLIQSVDSLHLAQEVSRQAVKVGKRQDIFAGGQHRQRGKQIRRSAGGSPGTAGAGSRAAGPSHPRPHGHPAGRRREERDHPLFFPA